MIEEKRKKEKVKEFVGGSISAFVGGTLGTALAGPLGAAIGAVAGFGVEFGLLTISDHINRVLSKHETKKIVTVIECATTKIKERLEKGDKPRSDGFFTDKDDERSADKELFEGVVFAAQREHEEKKIPYIANLYANIAFKPGISRAEANQLLHVASSISYRQICLIQAIGVLQLPKLKGLNVFSQARKQTVSGYENISLITEIYSLYQQGLLSSKIALFDPAGICPDDLSVTGVGAMLFQLMELVNIKSIEDVVSPLTFLTGKKIAQSQI